MQLRFVTLAAAALLIGSVGTSWAQSGTVQRTPGHMMQDRPTSTAPGASEYAPGHLKRRDNLGGPGASRYTPSHRTGNVGLSTERRTTTRTRTRP
jgi:hypothetical protein